MPGPTSEDDVKLFYFILKHTHPTPPWETIAKQMGLTSGAVQKRFARAMKRLGQDFDVAGGKSTATTAKATETKPAGNKGKRNPDKTEDEGPACKKVKTNMKNEGASAEITEGKDEAGIGDNVDSRNEDAGGDHATIAED